MAQVWGLWAVAAFQEGGVGTSCGETAQAVWAQVLGMDARG